MVSVLLFLLAVPGYLHVFCGSGHKYHHSLLAAASFKIVQEGEFFLYESSGSLEPALIHSVKRMSL